MANEQNLIPFTGKDDPRNGRKPKGSKHISTWIQELLNDEEFEATIQQGLQIKEYKGAPIKAIIQAQTRLAMNGDTKAFEALAKHGWKPQLDITSNDEKIGINLSVDQAEQLIRARAERSDS